MGTVECTGVFASGKTAILTVTPSAGYTFENCTENGHVVSIVPVFEFMVEYHRDLVANFQLEMSIASNNSNEVVVFPNPFTNSISLTNF